MLIVIIGPDGSGKTTIANCLVEEFNKRKINAHHLAMHVEILPKLKDLVNPFLKNKIDHSHEEGELNAGMKVKVNSPMRGAIYVAWYSIDYFLGHLKIKKHKQNGEHVIFARYYFDYYYQRTHDKTPRWFIKIFERLIPKPDYIFTINRNAKDIYRLKPELSIEEIKIQQNKIKSAISFRKNAYEINGELGIEATLNEILKIIKI